MPVIAAYPPVCTPFLAVTIPTESTFVTSSYVRTPLTARLPVTEAPSLVVAKRSVLLWNRIGRREGGGRMDEHSSLIISYI